MTQSTLTILLLCPQMVRRLCSRLTEEGASSYTGNAYRAGFAYMVFYFTSSVQELIGFKDWNNCFFGLNVLLYIVVNHSIWPPSHNP